MAEDAVAVHATIHMQQRASYRVHETDAGTAIQLREYVNTDGTVFAVAWRSPVMPNLKQMLGPYFGAYRASARLKTAPHRAVRVQQEDLVIESTGHMRAFSGIAYLPKLLPAGVTAGELQ